jgi:hypothetical protein
MSFSENVICIFYNQINYFSSFPYQPTLIINKLFAAENLVDEHRKN